MSKPIRTSLLLVAVILLAAPALAKACPDLVGNDEAAQSAEIFVVADKNVDCSKLDDDDAREKCREARHERNDGKYDNKDRDLNDVDADNVDCSKFKDDDARRRCARRKITN